jgi:thioredoxin reductase (NADPH)
MTEAVSCRDEQVFVIGAGNSAGQAALFLSQYAANVTMLVRGESLSKSMSQYLVERIEQTAKIGVRINTELVGINGEQRLQAICVRNRVTGQEEMLEGTAIFSFIGAAPPTHWLDGLVARDEHGFILSGTDIARINGRPANWPLSREPFLLETSVPGIFVAGDVRHGSVKRVASGVGEGSIVVSFIHQYLSNVQ